MGKARGRVKGWGSPFGTQTALSSSPGPTPHTWVSSALQLPLSPTLYTLSTHCYSTARLLNIQTTNQLHKNMHLHHWGQFSAQYTVKPIANQFNTDLPDLISWFLVSRQKRINALKCHIFASLALQLLSKHLIYPVYVWHFLTLTPFTNRPHYTHYAIPNLLMWFGHCVAYC